MAEPAVLPKDLAANPVLARWIRVGPDGRIDVRVGKVELGQGILTALAQLAADELDVDLAGVRMLGADTADGPDEGVTAGSLSISACGPALRAAAANVRMLFVTAAARDWRVDPSRVTVRSGRFTGPEGQRSSYAELAARVDLEAPADPTVPVRGEARIAGTDVPRLDLPDKVAGRPRYVQDLRLSGQWYARVVRPPSPGARLRELDPAVAGDGITVVRDGSFLAVAGPDEAAVLRAADRVRAKAAWAETDTMPDEDDLDGFLRAGPHETLEVAADGVNDGTATGVPGAGGGPTVVAAT
jgi:nicotinate dehydrogenase subunit B